MAYSCSRAATRSWWPQYAALSRHECHTHIDMNAQKHAHIHARARTHTERHTHTHTHTLPHLVQSRAS